MRIYKPALLLFMVAFFTLGQTTSPDKWMGAWKLNLAKSKYQSTPPKNRVLKFEPVPGGLKATSDLTDTEGVVHIEFTAKYDGKDVVMNGPAIRQTIAVTRVDAYTFDTFQKSSGTVTSTARYVVSKDGKTLTTTSTATAPTGEKVTNISVYDRQ
jgi:hypothetical protein